MRTLEQIKDRYILMVLHHCGGDRTACAEMLDISIRTLRYKIKGYMRRGYPVPEHHNSVSLREYYRKKKYLQNLD